MKSTSSGRVIRGAAAAAVCLALALGTAGVASAGQGPRFGGHSNISSHDHGQWNDARGVVTAFTTTSITIAGRHGTPTTYDTTGATYFEGKTAGVYADLAVGEHVKLALSSTTPQTVTSVTICLERVFGTVTNVTGDVITLSASHGTTITVNVDVGGTTTTFTSDGAASTLAAVVDGAIISAVGIPGSTAGSLNANSVNIFVPRLKTHVRGVVTAFTTTSITLAGHHGSSTTYNTTGATYAEGSMAGAETDLAVGERVNLALTSTSPQTVTKVTICLDRVSGLVTNFTGNVITITSFHGISLAVTVIPGTTTYTSMGAASSSAAVLNGVWISAVGLPGTTAGSFNAISVNIGPPNGHKFGFGNSKGHSQGPSFGRHHH